MNYLMMFILALVSLSLFAQTTRGVDKVKALKWDGESYRVTLTNFQREIKISGKNAMVPCLENAFKSNMEVLLVIDSDIPIVKSCKLYSPGLIKKEDLPK